MVLKDSRVSKKESGIVKKESGYMTVEAAFWLPAIALFLTALIMLCSWLYQGCFMMQAAYLAAFRGSRTENAAQRERETLNQLDELMERQVLSFAEAAEETEAGTLAVTVTLRRDTPLMGPDGEKLVLERTQQSLYLDPVAYIRGLQFLERLGENSQ